MYSASSPQQLITVVKLFFSWGMCSKLRHNANPKSIKIPTVTLKHDQALLPEKTSRVSPFFGFDPSPTNSRPATPESTSNDFLRPLKVNSQRTSASPDPPTVASPPRESGREGGRKGRRGEHYQGDVVLIGFLCPERLDIAASVADHPLDQPDGAEFEIVKKGFSRDNDDKIADQDMDVDIDAEFAEMNQSKEEGDNGNQNQAPPQESGGCSNKNEPEDSGKEDNDNGNVEQPSSSGSGTGGLQGGSSGGDDGNDEEKKPPMNGNEMDIDNVMEEKVEKQEEEGEIQKARLESIASLASMASAVVKQEDCTMDILPSSDAANGLIALHHSNSLPNSASATPDSANRHNAPPPVSVSNGSIHSCPTPMQPTTQPQISTLAVISESNHQPPGKPTLPSIHTLAEVAIQQGYPNPPPPSGHFSPNQSGQRSLSDTPQPAPLSPPNSSQPQAGYGPDGAHARKPLHHMTVQERANYVPPVYYPPYPYPPLCDEMHAPGAPPSIPPTMYTPNHQQVYTQGRELPGLFNQPPSSYHYHEPTPPDPQPLRRGSSANMFAQAPFSDSTPSGPDTGSTNASGGERETSAGPTVRSPKRTNRDGQPVTGSFKCEHPGCHAPAFQTQYLLK